MVPVRISVNDEVVMFWWTIALFVIDMGLMAAILYILAGRRPAFAHPGAEGLDEGQRHSSAPAELIERLKKELGSVRLVKKELDRKIHSLDSYEDALKGREKELKDLIMRARKTEGGRADDQRKQAEIYRAAIRMAGEGRSVEDIVKSLGMLRGEAELISSLKSFNS